MAYVQIVFVTTQGSWNVLTLIGAHVLWLILQVAGTVGRKLMMGVRQGLPIDAKTKLDVRCKVGCTRL